MLAVPVLDDCLLQRDLYFGIGVWVQPDRYESVYGEGSGLSQSIYCSLLLTALVVRFGGVSSSVPGVGVVTVLGVLNTLDC